ncbi:MAG: citrate transporter [Gammaproteobacteria bacterium]|nr:citrate transporter [Gammaproteobacteria bacterium]
MQTLVVESAITEITGGAPVGLEIFGIPVAFIFFALTLLGVAVFHHQTLRVALIGLCVIVGYKFFFSSFEGVPGIEGLLLHVGREWVTLGNLFGLLMGFALLANHFERSRIPDFLPALLPDDWHGGLVLLIAVFFLSTFLDNIAAAIIGGSMASAVFRGKLHIGYLAAIVAASNAGGAGSVVGDTTTSMMWIEGVSPLVVARAFLPALVALTVFGIPAAIQQQKHSPIVQDPPKGLRLDWSRVGVVLVVVGALIGTNVFVNAVFHEYSSRFPFLGAAVWAALLLTAAWRRPDWSLLPNAARGSVFLLSLVTCASLMPVESLPVASWPTTAGLGFVSAVFDNIPLTKLALEQGGYDWGALAFAVGFGGSMIWFGSSAGVALATKFPEAKSVGSWLRYGWYVPLGYLAGLAAYLLILGWHPTTG